MEKKCAQKTVKTAQYSVYLHGDLIDHIETFPAATTEFNGRTLVNDLKHPL